MPLFHLQPPEDEIFGDEGVKGKEEEEEVIPPTPVPKEWDCLGSDVEIKEGFMEPGRPLVSGLRVHVHVLSQNLLQWNLPLQSPE